MVGSRGRFPPRIDGGGSTLFKAGNCPAHGDKLSLLPESVRNEMIEQLDTLKTRLQGLATPA